jgi:hypothetical protein
MSRRDPFLFLYVLIHGAINKTESFMCMEVLVLVCTPEVHEHHWAGCDTGVVLLKRTHSYSNLPYSKT